MSYIFKYILLSILKLLKFYTLQKMNIPTIYISTLFTFKNIFTYIS